MCVSRLQQLAEILVGYSTAVQPGDLVRIAGAPAGLELAVALFHQVVKAGGNPFVSITPDECRELMLTNGTQEQLRHENPVEQYMAETVDVHIGYWGSDNTKSLTNTAADRQALMSQARKRYQETFLGRAAAGELRWVGTQMPCHAAAQDAEMSLREYRDFVFRAGKLHLADPVNAWRQLSQQQQRLADFLETKCEIRFVTPQGTDLKLGIEGRKWINCDGHENFPDGEVFTGPIEDATTGRVCYSFPAVHGGKEVHEIQLTFGAGKVVHATATKGEDFLLAMLDQDPGARVLGEVAIGTNYSITRHSKNTLFDEKIGGTFHAALGAAYPESGGTNQSGLHWDMVCDLRQGGQIFADGELISDSGRLLNDAWPQPI